jgi:hypothetical protein
MGEERFFNSITTKALWHKGKKVFLLVSWCLFGSKYYKYHHQGPLAQSKECFPLGVLVSLWFKML